MLLKYSQTAVRLRHQRLIHTLCSTLPRLCLGGSCRRQLRQAYCTGAVPTARLWARRTITYHNMWHSYRSWMPSRQTTNRPIHLSIRQDILRQSTPLLASRLSNQPLLGIQTCRISHYSASRLVESAVRAPRERAWGIHLESTHFLHFLQCPDGGHELRGVMTRVVSTNVTFEDTLLNQDTRSIVQQSKVGITRSAIDGALVLEYEDMFTGKRSKLSRPNVCALVE